VSFFISNFLFSGIAVRDLILSIRAERAREKFALFFLFIRKAFDPNILVMISGSIPKRLSLTLWQRLVTHLLETLYMPTIRK